MLAIPVVIVFWIVGFVWKGRQQGFLTLAKIDVDAGRREVDWERINSYKAHVASKPLWRRAIHAAF
jgi:amino acid transporter